MERQVRVLQARRLFRCHLSVVRGCDSTVSHSSRMNTFLVFSSFAGWSGKTILKALAIEALNLPRGFESRPRDQIRLSRDPSLSPACTTVRAGNEPLHFPV